MFIIIGLKKPVQRIKQHLDDVTDGSIITWRLYLNKAASKELFLTNFGVPSRPLGESPALVLRQRWVSIGCQQISLGNVGKRMACLRSERKHCTGLESLTYLLLFRGRNGTETQSHAPDLSLV